MEKQISENFRNWACSLSGCDGGNPDADIWVCGIEWGGNRTEDYYQNDLRKEIEAGAYIPEAEYNWEEQLKYRYGISFAKLYTAIYGHDVGADLSYLSNKEHKVFKLNLYPIPFRNTDASIWNKYNLKKTTGINDKFSYAIWCQLNRFPAISNFINGTDSDNESIIYSPKIIIGTGISYASDFLQCFASGNLSQGVRLANIEANGEKREYFYGYLDKLRPDGKRTLIVVTPFLSGRYGLNSNALLQEMGDKIRSLAEF
jgi:hypothetical protein